MAAPSQNGLRNNDNERVLRTLHSSKTGVILRTNSFLVRRVSPLCRVCSWHILKPTDWVGKENKYRNQIKWKQKESEKKKEKKKRKKYEKKKKRTKRKKEGI